MGFTRKPNWPYFPHIGLNPSYCGFLNFTMNTNVHTVQYKRRAVAAQTARSRCKLAYYPYSLFRPIILGLTKGNSTWRRIHY